LRTSGYILTACSFRQNLVTKGFLGEIRSNGLLPDSLLRKPAHRGVSFISISLWFIALFLSMPLGSLGRDDPGSSRGLCRDFLAVISLSPLLEASLSIIEDRILLWPQRSSLSQTPWLK